ncbi:hypothetical protein CLHOM_14420 [Clostridium homopropionicum DSM 5847]|uniref:Uncharacterized protein n=1 Tax=Clostridium homopropionicum DSM 5847 TaxID=1121318 RepID=A0A0L6ZBA2_9CLOT|nr:hypothetical protein [Clostridium homopropionicum]KOA20237.1 hypothetical protein CLHOM_14420 [Clostridium homopropionicum DSM 5847]SFG58033.1 hypothetical protein SAMN04488501_11129 [Clostridium homopropionicum]
MNSFKEETFLIEIKDELFYFYRNDEKIYLVKYKQNQLIEEKFIINNCKYLNNVILNHNNEISLIITSYETELILFTILNEEITNRITLIESLQNAKYVQIASVNNALNIFYINNNTLCFRILNNKLLLSPPLILDIIDKSCKPPFIINAENNELSICYIKNGYPNLIGYREFNFRKNSWSNFNVLDSAYFLIKDYSFIKFKEIIGYSFIFSKQNINNNLMRFGFGSKSNIKRDLIEEYSNIFSSNTIFLGLKNKFNLLYIVDNIIKLKEIDLNNNTEYIIDLDIFNIKNIKKFSFQSNNNIYTNFIFAIECENETIYTDNYFYRKHLDKSQKIEMNINNNYSAKNFTVKEIDSYEIANKDMYLNPIQENIVEELNIKLKKYEEKLNLISKNKAKNDEEKNKLRLGMASLYEEITKKYNRINTLEKALTEKQNLIFSYEKKLKDLTSSTSKLQNKELELGKKEEEILELKKLITEKDMERSNYSNELKNLKEEIAKLNRLVKDKTEEINNLKTQLNFLEEKNKESFIKKIFKTGY